MVKENHQKSKQNTADKEQFVVGHGICSEYIYAISDTRVDNTCTLPPRARKRMPVGHNQVHMHIKEIDVNVIGYHKINWL